MLLGAHMSISGGLHLSLERGRSIGCTAIQIFTKNASQWRAKPITDEDISAYLEMQAETGIGPVVAHDSYLINLASSDRALFEKSYDAFRIEMQRAESLGIPHLVTHPGAHKGAGEEEGIRLISGALTRLHRDTPGFNVKVCLETTAGQGTSLGHTFEQIARMIELTEESDRLSVCLDTCHVFVASYPLSTVEEYHSTMDEFDRIIGLDRLAVIHLNDAKKGAGSRVDRHEHIGKGEMGLEAFRGIMNDKRLDDVPKLLETHKGKDMEEDVMNMDVLKSLVEN
ncbi:deoxyribonuclease IV [candidate division KSB1 bacterium]